MAITDHDTLDAFDAAREAAGAEGVELVCGIEINTKCHGRAIHILGYFLEAPPGEEAQPANPPRIAIERITERGMAWLGASPDEVAG